jgi:hypothetical protein
VNGLAKSAIEGTANSSRTANSIAPQIFLQPHSSVFNDLLFTIFRQQNFPATTLHNHPNSSDPKTQIMLCLIAIFPLS